MLGWKYEIFLQRKIIAVLLTVMLTGITVLHVSGGQTIKVNAAQTFKVHFIDVGPLMELCFNMEKEKTRSMP